MYKKLSAALLYLFLSPVFADTQQVVLLCDVAVKEVDYRSVPVKRIDIGKQRIQINISSRVIASSDQVSVNIRYLYVNLKGSRDINFFMHVPEEKGKREDEVLDATFSRRNDSGSDSYSFSEIIKVSDAPDESRILDPEYKFLAIDRLTGLVEGSHRKDFLHNDGRKFIVQKDFTGMCSPVDTSKRMF